MAGSNIMMYDFSLVGLNTYLNTHNGRDKIGKVVQFVARGMAGYLTELEKAYPDTSEQRKVVQQWRKKFQDLFVRIMQARHTVRWLSSLGIILALRSGNKPWGKGETEHRAWVASQLLLLWWHFWVCYCYCCLMTVVPTSQP